MTELAFHFGAPDKLAYACRLLRKAVRGGARVAVVAEATALAQLDVDLWGVSPTDFVPHCIGNAPPAVQARSAVVLVNHTDQVTAPYGVLVNLGADVPQGFEKFDRLTEVVNPGGASVRPVIDSQRLVEQILQHVKPRLEQQLRASLQAQVEAQMRLAATRWKLEIEDAVKAAVKQAISPPKPPAKH